MSTENASNIIDHSTNLASPIVSIICVCYNEEPSRIDLTFSSIISQTYPNIEFVVMDGGSVDSTINAIKTYSEDIDYFESQADKGIYDAMNKGVSRCGGDYIMFMNVGDCFYASDVVSRLISQALKHSSHAYYYGDLMTSYGDTTKFVQNPPNIGPLYMFREMICHQAILARRELFEQVGKFNADYKIVADRDWLYRVYQAGYSGLHVDCTVCVFEVTENSLAYSLQYEHERHTFVTTYYSNVQRLVFGLIWNGKKIFRRWRSRNFAIPVMWRKHLNN